MWEPGESVSFKPVGDGFEDEGLFCHDQAEATYLKKTVLSQCTLKPC